MSAEELTGDMGAHGGPNVPRHNDEHRIITRLEKRRDWVVPERSWESTPETLQTFIENNENEVRERISAARTLVMMSNSGLNAQSIEMRINQQLAVVVAPQAPEDIDIQVQPAFIEQVDSDDLGETVEVLKSLGLLDRYVEQVKNVTLIETNGNGKHHGNGKQ